MELISLRTFQAVVEEGGIISASRKLNTVQSNVTSRIKRLEEELGTELFYRKGRGLELAPSGHVLLEYSRQLLQLEQQAEAAVRQVGEQSGVLRIGAMESFASLRLAPALKAVRKTHSGVELQIQTDTSAGLITRVLDHKLDCAFVGGAVDHPNLVVQQVVMEQLVLVRPAQVSQHPLPLILFRDGCAYRERALSWQRENGHHTGEMMELGTLDGMLGCIAMGLGCTLMPRWIPLHSRHRNDLVVEALPEHLAQIQTLMIRRRDSLSMKAMDTLFEAARNFTIGESGSA